MVHGKIPIIGEEVVSEDKKIVCVACSLEVRRVPYGMICDNHKCIRWGLVSVIGRDPDLKPETKEEEG